MASHISPQSKAITIDESLLDSSVDENNLTLDVDVEEDSPGDNFDFGSDAKVATPTSGFSWTMTSRK